MGTQSIQFSILLDGSYFPTSLPSELMNDGKVCLNKLSTHLDGFSSIDVLGFMAEVLIILFTAT